MQQQPYESEFSFGKLYNDRAEDVRYIWSFKKWLILIVAVGAFLGAVAAYIKRPTYTARLTFVVDDSKASSGGGLASLAGQFGLDIGSVGGGSGVLAGDNVEQLLVSKKLVQRTLLSPYDSAANNSLADKYAQVNRLDKKWLKYSPDGKTIIFPSRTKSYTRLQDSLLHVMTELILAGDFGISKTDKKLGFFEVNATMKDELLAQLFCTRMIKEATQFYIASKTTRLRTNVNRLQFRADSIGKILSKKTYAVSSATQSLLDLNPAYETENAGVEVKERSKTLLNTIFTETVKNLEASKAQLAQETPTVQIVDEPELPLKKNTLKYPIAITEGALAGLIATSIVLLLFRKKE